MVVILTEQNDVSTLEVVDYLRLYSIPYMIINESMKVKIHDIFIQNNQLSFTIDINERKINSKDITSFWYRRGAFNWDENEFPLNGIKGNEVSELFSEFQQVEYSTLKQFIELMPGIKKIGLFEKREINKLEMLNAAIKVGLNVPNTSILNSKQKIIDSFHSKSIITKGIQVTPIIFSKYGKIYGYTEKIELNEIPDKFAFTLFQDEIEKRIEIRSFYLENNVYSMAIFSQNDNSTKVDFRKYNKEKPNRMVPFKLPAEIESKLLKLSKKLSLNCGSADFIIDRNGDYYFLEINPIGQYQFVDYFCNYKINRKIATHLSQYSEL